MGRAEMVVGRGSFIDAFPLFDLSLQDYDALFEAKLDLLLKIRDNEQVHWTGYFPGYAKAVSSVAEERGWGPVTRESFDAQRGPDGALLIGEPDEVAEKIIRHSEALGGISRITFQMNAASLPHAKLMQAIEALGTRVAPALRTGLADD